MQSTINHLNAIPKRDIELDVYRALVMLYILCVVHVGYWLNYIEEPFRSFILVEMPLIFFISGASLSITKPRKSLRDTITNRFKRIAVPYYIYVSCYFMLLSLLSIFIHIESYQPGWRTLFDFMLFQENVHGTPMQFYWHIWFILPYLSIYILFWFEQQICDSYNPWVIAVSLLLTCIAAQFLDKIPIIGFLRTVLIYNFFFVMGYLFYRKLSINKILLLCLGAATVLFFIYLVRDSDQTMTDVFCPMQRHKFDADLIFLIYGIFALCLLSIIFSFIHVKANKVFDIWNKHGYTIYLWQNIFFTIEVI